MKSAIEFIPVKNMDEVIAVALLKTKKRGFKLDMAKQMPFSAMESGESAHNISHIKQ